VTAAPIPPTQCTTNDCAIAATDLIANGSTYSAAQASTNCGIESVVKNKYFIFINRPCFFSRIFKARDYDHSIETLG